MISNINQKDIYARLFISEQNQKFQSFLDLLNEDTRHIIKKNKQLNELFDIFLDYIIDSGKILDYIDSKEHELGEK